MEQAWWRDVAGQDDEGDSEQLESHGSVPLPLSDRRLHLSHKSPADSNTGQSELAPQRNTQISHHTRFSANTPTWVNNNPPFTQVNNRSVMSAPTYPQANNHSVMSTPPFTQANNHSVMSPQPYTQANNHSVMSTQPYTQANNHSVMSTQPYTEVDNNSTVTTPPLARVNNHSTVTPPPHTQVNNHSTVTPPPLSRVNNHSPMVSGSGGSYCFLSPFDSEGVNKHSSLQAAPWSRIRRQLPRSPQPAREASASPVPEPPTLAYTPAPLNSTPDISSSPHTPVLSPLTPQPLLDTMSSPRVKIPPTPVKRVYPPPISPGLPLSPNTPLSPSPLSPSPHSPSPLSPSPRSSSPDVLPDRLPHLYVHPPSRQNKLDEMLLSSGRVSEALTSLLEWLQKAESYLAEDQPILGDIDTVTILIEQHKAFDQELASRANMRDLLKASTDDPNVASQLEEVTACWDSVCQASAVRESRLQEAHKLAEEFNEAVRVVREWLPQAEAELKFRALPEDEESILVLMEQHEKFQEDLRGQQPKVEKIRFLAEEILQGCHPNAARFVKYYLTITQTRWEQAINRSNQRSIRLQEALRNIRGNTALLEELLAWLTEAQALLTAKEKDPTPEDLTVVESLAREHLEFHEDLANKNKDADRLTKTSSSGGKVQQPESPSQRVHALHNKWRAVWRMSVDRKKRLQDALDHLMELESFKNFNFDQWRDRYNTWIRSEKLRITDFFRRQDKDGDGSLTRSEFVEGMLSSKFPTNRTEMNAVFDIFDRNKSGSLDYQEFVNALKPDRRVVRMRPGKRSPTDNEVIQDEVEQQVSHCQCRHQFKSVRVGDGKYKFGEKGKLYLIRLVNSAVMVRVGGGWMALAEFLDNNDPCRTLNSSLSGSVTSLHEKTLSPLNTKNKQGPTARSWSNLSQGSSNSLKVHKQNPQSAPRRSIVPEPVSPIAHSSPRRSTLHTPTAASRSRQVTPKSSTPKSARNKDFSSTNGSETSSVSAPPSESRTPTSQRSRSPANRPHQPPRKLTTNSSRPHMKF